MKYFFHTNEMYNKKKKKSESVIQRDDHAKIIIKKNLFSLSGSWSVILGVIETAELFMSTVLTFSIDL